MGTFTVSIEVETVNVPIIGLAQARASGRVSDPGGSDPPAASAAPLPSVRTPMTLIVRMA